MSWNLIMLGGLAAFSGLILAGMFFLHRLKMPAQAENAHPAENAPPAGKPPANRELELWFSTSAAKAHLDATELESQRNECLSPYQFNPVGREWQIMACSALGLRFVRSNEVGPGGPCVPLKAPEARTIRRIAGDGNCLFRSLAYVLTGSEDQHLVIRQRIVHHMFTISELLLGIHIPNRYRSVEAYIRGTKMNRGTTCGTDVEILTMAHLLDTSIFSYIPKDKQWWRFSPNFVDASLTDDCKGAAIYINHPPGHFEVVRSIVHSPLRCERKTVVLATVPSPWLSY